MVEPAWTWRLQKEIPSSKDIGHELIEQLLAALSEAGWEGRDFFHVQMAAEEAMINAITHGNRESADKTVDVEFRVSQQSAYIRFQDQGEGFCPDNLPDPRDDDHLACTNGRGVLLIKEMMNEVHYNERGNEITMIKHRQTESAKTQ